ncbi:MAG: lipoprotein [Psychroflexus sp.]|nr:lipoprotein [Psychroflexus sp.]
MKKILFSFIALLALSACSDDDFGSDSSLTPQSFQVHVNFDSDNY